MTARAFSLHLLAFESLRRDEFLLLTIHLLKAARTFDLALDLILGRNLVRAPVLLPQPVFHIGEIPLFAVVVFVSFHLREAIGRRVSDAE